MGRMIQSIENASNKITYTRTLTTKDSHTHTHTHTHTQSHTYSNTHTEAHRGEHTRNMDTHIHTNRGMGSQRGTPSWHVNLFHTHGGIPVIGKS